AIENALKAVRVKQEKSGVTTNTPGRVHLSSLVKTHDLRGLAGDAGIPLSTADADLLDRLTAFLVWAGRYPVAATAEGQAVVQVIWGSDQATIREFFGRVAAAFQQL